MAAEKPIDWEAVEREYRAGQLSVREIAKAAGVSHTLINRRAKNEGWTRNLADRVREAVSSKLVSSGVSNAGAKQIVEVAATRAVDVILSHRKDIARLRSIAAALADELEADAKKVSEERMSVKDRSDILDRLSRTAVRLTQLERQAFGLDETRGGAPKDDDIDATRQQLMDRISRLAAEEEA